MTKSNGKNLYDYVLKGCSLIAIPNSKSLNNLSIQTLAT